MPLGPFEDGVQPTVAADPRQGALDANPFRNEGSAVGAGGDAKRFASLGQPLTAIADTNGG